MPKISLLQNTEVVDLVNKKVAQAEALAAKAATRTYKSLVRAAKEAIGTANLDRKIAKGLTEHVVTAMSAHAPGAEAQPAAE